MIFPKDVLSKTDPKALISLLGWVFYTVYLHPLRHIPGPWYCAVSRLPYIYTNLNGTCAHWLHGLHEQYGDMVRYTPNEVSGSARPSSPSPTITRYSLSTRIVKAKQSSRSPSYQARPPGKKSTGSALALRRALLCSRKTCEHSLPRSLYSPHQLHLTAGKEKSYRTPSPTKP